MTQSRRIGSKCVSALLIVSLCTLAQPVSGQTHTLLVRVLDARNRPVSGVQILTAGRGATVTSDRNGQAIIGVPQKPGDRVTLQIAAASAKNWTFLEPFFGDVIVANDFVNVWVMRPGDRDALQNSATWGRIDSQMIDGRIPKGVDVVGQLAARTGLPESVLADRFREWAGSVDSNTSDQLVAQRLERAFQAAFDRIGSDLRAMTASNKEMSAKLDELMKLAQKGSEQEQVQRLQRDNERIQAELDKAKGRVDTEARLRNQLDALQRNYEELVRRLNAQAGTGGTNVTYTSGGAGGTASGGGMSMAAALGTLGAIAGVGAGLAVLSKKLAPKADATFTMSPDCSSPCALIPGVTAAQFSVTTQDTATFDYRWNFGNNRTDRGTTVTHTFFDPGTFGVTLTVVPHDSESGAVGATASRTVTVRSLTGLWRFTAASLQGSFQLTQNGTSMSGSYTIGTTQGSSSGNVTNPRAVRMNVGFNGDSLDGTSDSALNTITGNYRVAATGVIQPFTLTRVQ